MSGDAGRTTKAGFLAMSEIVTTITRLGTMIILARVFSRAEFGNYRQVLLPFTFLMPLLAMGLADGLLYFLTIKKEETRAVLTNNVVLLSISGVLFGLFFFMGGNHLLAWSFKNEEIAIPYLYFAPFALLCLPTSSIRGCLVAAGHLRSLAAYTIVSRVVIMLAVTATAYLYGTFEQVIIALVISTGVFVVPASWMMYKSCRTGSWAFRKPEAIEQVKYCFPLGIGTAINMISRNLDKVVVSIMCPKEMFAVYVVGAMELPIINIVVNSAASVITPDFTQLFRDGKKEEFFALWHRANLKCISVIVPVTAFLAFAAPTAVVGVFTDRYVQSVLVFQIYLLLVPMRMFVFSAVFLATNQTKKIVSRSVVAIFINGLLTVGMTWKFGYIGAAWATIMTFALWIFPYNLYFSCKQLEASIWQLINFPKTLLVVVCSAIPLVIFLMPLPKGWLEEYPLLVVMIWALAYFLPAGALMHVVKLIDLKQVIRGALKSLGRS